jgi:malate permease and related proteins
MTEFAAPCLSVLPILQELRIAQCVISASKLISSHLGWHYAFTQTVANIWFDEYQEFSMLMVMLQMALLIAVGVLWQRYAPSHITAIAHRRALTDLVFYILLPALVLHVIWQTPFDASSIKISLTALATLAVSMLLMWLCFKWMKVTRQQQGALLLAATFPNATYLGLPVTGQVLGDWTQAVVLKYDLFACTPVLLTIGMLMAHRFGNTQDKIHPLQELMRVPPLWALAVASLLNVTNTPQPELVAHALQTLSGGVIPLMLIALGMSIRWDTLQVRFIPMLLPVCVIALVFAPLVAWGVGGALALESGTLTAVVLLSAMPTMIFGIVICERYGLDGALYAAAVFLTSLLSIATLTVWFNVL